MTSFPVSLETILRDAWKLLRRNWVLVVPLLLAGVAILAIVAVFVVVLAVTISPAGNKMSNAVIATIAIGYVVVLLFALAASIAVTDATYGMADALWIKGTTGLDDGATAARARFGATVVAFVGFLGLAIAALVLLIPTLGLALLAFPVVTMYVFPAVITGGYGGFAAFGESWRLVRRYFSTSAIGCLILIALQYLITMVLYVMIVPLEFGLIAATSGKSAPSLVAVGMLGALLCVVLLVVIAALYVYHAYYTVAIVGLYRWLRARAAAEDAAAAPAPAAAPLA